MTDLHRVVVLAPSAAGTFSDASQASYSVQLPEALTVVAARCLGFSASQILQFSGSPFSVSQNNTLLFSPDSRLTDPFGTKVAIPLTLPNGIYSSSTQLVTALNVAVSSCYNGTYLSADSNGAIVNASAQLGPTWRPSLTWQLSSGAVGFFQGQSTLIATMADVSPGGLGSTLGFAAGFSATISSHLCLASTALSLPFVVTAVNAVMNGPGNGLLLTSPTLPPFGYAAPSGTPYLACAPVEVDNSLGNAFAKTCSYRPPVLPPLAAPPGDATGVLLSSLSFAFSDLDSGTVCQFSTAWVEVELLVRG